MLFAFLRRSSPPGREGAESERQTGTRAREGGGLSWKTLWASVSICLVLALLFYFAAFYFSSEKHAPPNAADLLKHLSTAFLVALILMVGLEIHARKRAHKEFTRYLEELSRYREKVAEDVFEAVLGRIVPEPIAEEVKQVLRIGVIKSQCEYIISFQEPYPGMPVGYAVLRRDLTFRVTNLLAQAAAFPLISYYTSDEDVASAAWGGRPFHVKVVVNGVTILPRPTGSASGPQDGEKSFKFEHQVELAPRGFADVYLGGEEPVRVEAGRSSYIQSTPVDYLTVTVRKNYKPIGDVKVQMHHPAWTSMEHDANIGRYVLRRAFLPGQGFEISWKKSEAGEEVKSSSTQGPV